MLGVLTGCGGSNSKTIEQPPLPVVTPPADDYIGIWQQTGYGQYLDITTEQVNRYEASNDTCIQTHSISRDEFPTKFNWTVKEQDDERFVVHEHNVATIAHTLEKTTALPASCSTLLENTPSNIVNHLVNMANEYYVFFEVRNIDWQAASELAISRVHDDMNSEQLKEVLIELLAVFNDRHVILHAKAIDLFAPELSFEDISIFGQVNDFDQQIINEYESLAPSVSLEEYYSTHLAAYYAAIHNKMDNGLKSKGGENNDKVAWGTIGNDVGYLYIGELEQFDPSQPASFGEENIAPHIVALNTVLDEAVADLKHTSRLILDIRMHSGGTISLDRTIAKRFIEQTINYGSFHAIGEQPRQLTMVPYDGERFTQETIIITSNFVQSSGEDMLMALKADGDIIQIGETTLGTFSDTLFLSLPNQWAFSLSNQIWLDKDGNSWESIGIIPEHQLDVFTLEDRQLGVDSAINKALELFQ